MKFQIEMKCIILTNFYTRKSIFNIDIVNKAVIHLFGGQYMQV